LTSIKNKKWEIKGYLEQFCFLLQQFKKERRFLFKINTKLYKIILIVFQYSNTFHFGILGTLRPSPPGGGGIPGHLKPEVRN